MKREVRYEGNDESYAVNELYMKIREAMILRKNYKKQAEENQSDDEIPVDMIKDKIKKSKLTKILIILGIIIVILSIIF